MGVKLLAAVDLDDHWTHVVVDEHVYTTLIQCRDQIEVYYAQGDDPDEAYWTIKSGGTLAIDMGGLRDIGWFRLGSGTSQLEILSVY